LPRDKPAVDIDRPMHYITYMVHLEDLDVGGKIISTWIFGK